jgi:hypothetical protein
MQLTVKQLLLLHNPWRSLRPNPWRSLRPPRVGTILCILLLTFRLPGQSTQNDYVAIPDLVYKESIKSVQFYRTGWELSYPIMELNSPDQVTLSFDDLTDEIRNYSYSLIHCDANWIPTAISEQEYLEGFSSNQIYDYALSFNTYVSYVHYNLNIPNDDVRLLISGNYIVKILEDNDENKVIMTKRFVIVESQVKLDAKVIRPLTEPYLDSGHEIIFSIFYDKLDIIDPVTEIQVRVSQNNRSDLVLNDLKPLIIRQGMLEYSAHRNNILPGGNEYRSFEMKNLKYQSGAVKNIEFINPYYHIELMPDKPRNKGAYFYNEDINGRYFIDIAGSGKKNTDADYVFVHFTLLEDTPLSDGQVYVFGALTNWSIGNYNKMEYNSERNSYEASLLLKQGYYNYEYVFVSDKTHVIDPFDIEGSYYEAENDYLIYVYYRPPNARYDRLVGYSIVNSLRQ